MPPELSPVPTSPRSRRRAATAMQPATSSSLSSHRLSQVMGPPATTLPSTTYTGSPTLGAGQNGNIVTAPGPLRHPKPLTPSDLHSMLEREQEAMVNRLSRELSLLRQQTASVASTASSTSITFNDPIDVFHSSPYISSAHPTSSRRHRSSSSLSSSYIPAVQGSRTGSVTGIAPSRETSLSISSPRPDLSRSGRSREPSINCRQSEGACAPLLSSSQQQLQHGESVSHNVTCPNSQQKSSPANATSRFDEILSQRGELESIKRENEALRRRVRDLELVIKKYRESALADQTVTNERRKSSITEIDGAK